MSNFSLSYNTTRKLKDIKSYIATRCGLLTITATLFLMLPDCIISFWSVVVCPVCSVWQLGDHKQFTWHKKLSASTAVLLLSSHVMYQAIIVQHHGSTWLIFIIQDYLNSGLCPSSGILKNTIFQKFDLFLSSGEGVGDTYSFGHIWDPVSKMLCSLVFFRILSDGKIPKTQ
jgi:hypothetical protein